MSTAGRKRTPVGRSVDNQEQHAANFGSVYCRPGGGALA